MVKSIRLKGLSEPENPFFRNKLFVTSIKGKKFYTIAENFNEAVDKIESFLNEKNWFPFSDRKVREIEMIALQEEEASVRADILIL